MKPMDLKSREWLAPVDLCTQDDVARPGAAEKG